MVFYRQLVSGLVGLIFMSVAGGGYSAPTAASGGAIASDVVSGTVTYRARIAFPLDAVVEVSLSDVSKMDVAAPVIAKTTFSPKGRQVPLPFTLRYDPRDINPDRTYTVRAVIRSSGLMIFTTNRAYEVITRGNPTHIELRLVQVGQSALPSELWRTKWRLEDLEGAGVLDRTQATLAFPEAGRVAGSASCNRFFGTVDVSGLSIAFGALGSTRMSCAEAVMQQESRYLKALAGAERFTLDRAVLLIYYRGSDKPLRFVRQEEAATLATPTPRVFQASGTEPFWNLAIGHAGIRFATPDDPKGIRFPPADLTLTGDVLRWASKAEALTITVQIKAGTCSDGMSDRAWTHQAVVQLGGMTYQGCAEVASEPMRFSDLIGEWVIVDHRIPGISAMTGAEAAQWHSRKLRLGAKTATSFMSTCRRPVYHHRTAAANTFLQTKFRVAPEDLGLPARARLELTEIFCDNTRWTAPGGLLLRVPEGRLYTVWDGVFFELRR